MGMAGASETLFFTILGNVCFYFSGIHSRNLAAAIGISHT
jgi:hypothetical protein